MTSKLNLSNRVKKARAASLFIGQIANGKSTTYRVPGSQGKTYRVKIRRDRSLSVQCWAEHNEVPCPGCGFGTICYHSIAACIHLASLKNLKISWCASFKDAVHLSAMGGELFRVEAHNGNGTIWGVAK